MDFFSLLNIPNTLTRQYEKGLTMKSIHFGDFVFRNIKSSQAIWFAAGVHNQIDFDFASNNNDNYPSHCDIVIAVEKDFVLTLGGNVDDSVSRTNYKINAQGFLTGAGNVYAVLSNRQ